LNEELSEQEKSKGLSCSEGKKYLYIHKVYSDIMPVNILAIVVAAIVGMVIGALWYSPYLFGKTWMRLSKMSEKQLKVMKAKGMGKTYLIAFIAALVTAYVLALFIDLTQAGTLLQGIQIGFWVWLGFIATTMLGNVLWEGKPVQLYVLNVVHQLVSIAVMGAILAVWV